MKKIILLNAAIERGALWGALLQTPLWKCPECGQTSKTSSLNGYHVAPQACPTHDKFLVWTTRAEALTSLQTILVVPWVYNKGQRIVDGQIV